MAVASQHLLSLGRGQRWGEQGQSGHRMNLPWKLYPVAQKWPGVLTARSSPGRHVPSMELLGLHLSHRKHILNSSLGYSGTEAVWCMLNLGLTADGEVGSPVGLERGFQRVLMFLRSPLQSANCGNTVAQSRKWKHTARWWDRLLLN